MIVPCLPENEAQRLAALASFDILDSPGEADYDELVAFIASVCEAPIAFVSLVGADRQWFKSTVGLDATESPRAISFCGHTICSPDQLTIVPDTLLDPRFKDNPFVVDGPKLRFYAGAPLVDRNGFALGTVCFADTRPRDITAQQRDALRVGSRAVVTMLEQRRTIAQLESAQVEQERITAELRAEISRRRRIEAQLNFSSLHDGLTSLPNRREFMSRLALALARLHAPERRPFAVFFIDLDRFKQVNDTLGHLVGDGLLVEVSRRLADVIRENDAVARLGGDEFTMIADGVATVARAATLATRVAGVLAGELRVNGVDISVTASIGILVVDPSYESADDVLRDADIAMYAAKERGRDRYAIFAPEMRDEFIGASLRERKHASD